MKTGNSHTMSMRFIASKVVGYHYLGREIHFKLIKNKNKLLEVEND